MKCLKCGNEFKILTCIDGKIRNLSSRKYCLICSPFGQKNTKKIHKKEVVQSIENLSNGLKQCPNCKNNYTLENFFIKKNGKLFTYCKKCWNTIISARGVQRKKQAIEYKGGKCIKCGYNKYYGALDFHHRDSKEKEFLFKGLYSFEKIKKELDKCDLVCSNCHREIHAK